VCHQRALEGGDLMKLEIRKIENTRLTLNDDS
jgi:hypothetical protein